jgi:hypothetical protein
MGIIMKNFFNRLWDFFEDLGKARAAGYLARQGKVHEAVALMDTTKIL